MRKVIPVLRLLLALAASAVLMLPEAITRAAAPSGRYVIAAMTVYDTKTKLTWERLPNISKTYTWGSASNSNTAQNYCSALTINGVNGWRVPTLKELLTLVDYTVPGDPSNPTPTIDAIAFPSTEPLWYWTSTTSASSMGPWAVFFGSGATDTTSGSVTAPYVRCVQ